MYLILSCNITSIQFHSVAGKRVVLERTITSQVTSESLGQPPSVGSCLCAGKNSRASHDKVKKGLFREKHTPQTECRPLQKAREAQT